MPMYIKREEEVAGIKELIRQFPPEFGLQAFPGEKFRISERDSYWSAHEMLFMLYTEIYNKKLDKWLSFAKGDVHELQTNFTKYF